MSDVILENWKRFLRESKDADYYQKLHKELSDKYKKTDFEGGMGLMKMNGKIALTQDLINSGLKDHAEMLKNDDFEWQEILDNVFYYEDERLEQFAKWALHGIKPHELKYDKKRGHFIGDRPHSGDNPMSQAQLYQLSQRRRGKSE